jgi:hypothetical protein
MHAPVLAGYGAKDKLVREQIIEDTRTAEDVGHSRRFCSAVHAQYNSDGLFVQGMEKTAGWGK